ncbi:MAG: hypothetical protein JOZ06_13585 [Paludibacterium sp.]|nr:hypothetical protein [Paludibacterium sp.]MBV8648413.1 hypothetical protein [Paludibacterium sp.]
MEEVWLESNWTEWVVAQWRCATLSLFEGESLYSHGAQADNQKRCAEALSVDLAVYLVRRLVDSLPLQQTGQLFVPDAASHHLYFNQLFRSLLPSFIRLRLQTTRAWLSVHLSPTAATQPLSLPSRYFLTSIFGRIRLVGFCESYTSFARHFCEEKLPARTTPIVELRRIVTHYFYRNLTHSKLVVPSFLGSNTGQFLLFC